MIETRARWTLLLALAGCGAARAPVRSAARSEAQGVGVLRWLSGTWRYDEGGATTEEQWTLPEAGSMLGTGRVLREGRTGFFEFLAVRDEGGALTYTAWPRGGASTVFRATAVSAQGAVFENPAHDFPRRIEYRREGEGAVRVLLQGEEQGRARSESYVLRAVR